jgi:hypothetical protein
LYFANLHVNRGPAGEKIRFHMDDDGDLREQVLHIEAHLEELSDVIESCRKFILVSKTAIAAGGALILAISIREFITLSYALQALGSGHRARTIPHPDSSPDRCHPVFDRDGVVRRGCGAQGGWAQRRVGF